LYENLYLSIGDLFSQMTKILQEFRLELSALFLILGIFLTVIVITDNFFAEVSPDFLQGVHHDVGRWIVWLDVIGPILLIGAGYYVTKTVGMEREFDNLMQTGSRTSFKRNQDRIVELASNLTEDHRKRVQKKKEELHIRT